MGSRRRRLHAWLGRVLVSGGRLGLGCVVGLLVVLFGSVVVPSSWLSVFAGAQAEWGLFALLAVLGLMLLVTLVASLLATAYLVASMLRGHELDDREIGWCGVHVLCCALSLWMLTFFDTCGQTGTPACTVDTLLFVLDQFTLGSFGDAIDVFGPKFSGVELDALGSLTTLQVLAFRILCATAVLALLLRAAAPLVERWNPARLHRVHGAATWAYRAFGWTAVLSLAAWLVVILVSVAVEADWLSALEQRRDVLSLALQGVLGLVLVAVPMAAPFVCLVFLVLSGLARQPLGRRELWLGAAVWVLCAGALMDAIGSSACTGDPQAVAQCNDLLLGFVADQFYKGGFADVFDVYDWKFGPIPDDAFTWTDRLSIFSFRLLSAVLVVAAVAAWVQRRQRRSPSAGTAEEAADAAGGWQATRLLEPERFADTEPMPRPAA
jgi:hypothetical protein